MDPDQLDSIVESAVAPELEAIGDDAVCSALQAAVVREGELVYEASAGRTRLDARGTSVERDTPFDTASLTKPLVVGTLLMQDVAAGDIDLNRPVTDVLPGWSHAPRADDVSWRHLANHTSGLPDWRPLHRELPTDPGADELEGNIDAIRSRIRETDLEAPPGAGERYSDLGYIVLGFAIESLHGAPLEELARRRIFEPLALEQTRFVSARRGDAPLSEAAATERQPQRGLVCGRVHDRNAAALGGVAGHAGCFSTARNLAAFGAHLLAVDSGDEGDESLVDRDVLRHCWSDEARGAAGHHNIGWDTPSGSPSSSGRGFQAGRTVGHLGFTGTSIWIERDREIVAVLLTNRVHPSRDNDRIKPFRVRFHEAILEP